MFDIASSGKKCSFALPSNALRLKGIYKQASEHIPSRNDS